MTLRYFTGLFRIETADLAQPGKRSWSPDRFPRERVESGHETTKQHNFTVYMLHILHNFTTIFEQEFLRM